MDEVELLVAADLPPELLDALAGSTDPLTLGRADDVVGERHQRLALGAVGEHGAAALGRLAEGQGARAAA